MFTTCRHKICQQPGAAPEFEKWGEYVIWNAWKIHLTPPPTKNYCSAHFSDDSIFCLWKVGGTCPPIPPPVAPPLPTARKYTTISVLWWYNSTSHHGIYGKRMFRIFEQNGSLRPMVDLWTRILDYPWWSTTQQSLCPGFIKSTMQVGIWSIRLQLWTDKST